MSISAKLLASGAGWRVSDVICTAGPRDRPVDERHDVVCIALVTAGTFQYRTSAGAAVMAPGSLLLGNPDSCFRCGHEHATGDRCLSFHFEPEFMDAIASHVPDARIHFDRPRLPPLPTLTGVLAAAEAARDDGDPAALEEAALRLAGAVLAALGSSPRSPTPTRREERAVTAALRHIEAHSQTPLTLSALADAGAMSRYHFLRAFRSIVGLTPHQYVLRTRLYHAALALRRGGESVATVALDAGFNDLSTFHRRFRRLMGVSPAHYRARHVAD